MYKMPRRRAYRKRRAYRAKGLSKHQKTQVKRLINGTQELKGLNTTINSNPDAAGLFVRIQTPPQGDGLSERSGDQILLKRLQFRLSITGADTTQKVRLIVFRWSQDNAIGANVPTTGGILQNSDVMSFYNYTSYKNDRMRVLYDKTFPFTYTDANQKIVHFSLYGKRLGRKILEFNAATNLGTNQIYLMMISDSIAASHPSVIGYAQLTYTDS